jgi:magnesium-transporting ATPase (P-type)
VTRERRGKFAYYALADKRVVQMLEDADGMLDEIGAREKQTGDGVFAATVLDRGFLRVETERVGAETTFGRIITLVEDAEARKAPVQRFADRFTAYYIPVVVAVAALTYLFGRQPTAAVAVVLVACSCAIAWQRPRWSWRAWDALPGEGSS